MTALAIIVFFAAGGLALSVVAIGLGVGIEHVAAALFPRRPR